MITRYIWAKSKILMSRVNMTCDWKALDEVQEETRAELAA